MCPGGRVSDQLASNEILSKVMQKQHLMAGSNIKLVQVNEVNCYIRGNQSVLCIL